MLFCWFRSWIVCFFCLLLNSSLIAQRADSLSFTPGQMSFFDVDRAGNVYTVFKNKVSCFDAKGILLTTLVFQSWPTVDYVDASSFHTVLCYNQDLSSVYFSDNKLSRLTDPIKLGEYSLYDLGAITQSHQALITVYNNQSQKIEVYDKQLNKMLESMEATTFAEVNEKQLQLVESDSYLFLKPNAHCILIFNRQCAFVKRLDLLDVKCISAEGDRFVYSDGKDVFLCRTETSDIHKLVFPNLTGNIRRIVYRSNCIYTLLDDGIHAFSIKDVNQ